MSIIIERGARKARYLRERHSRRARRVYGAPRLFPTFGPENRGGERYNFALTPHELLSHRAASPPRIRERKYLTCARPGVLACMRNNTVKKKQGNKVARGVTSGRRGRKIYRVP